MNALSKDDEEGNEDGEWQGNGEEKIKWRFGRLMCMLKETEQNE